MKFIFRSNNLKFQRWLLLFSVICFVASVVGLSIHPERYFFVLPIFSGFIATLLFVFQIMKSYIAELAVNNMLILGEFTKKQTVISFVVEGKTLVSIELFNGSYDAKQIHLVWSSSEITLYEIAGQCYIVHEVCDLPFVTRDTVNFYSKKVN